MTTLVEKIAVMQAFEYGEKIQTKYNESSRNSWNPWAGTSHPIWAWNTFDYRVAPKPPREFWVNVYSHSMCTHPTKEQALQQGVGRMKECIHMIEILEE